MTSVPKRSHEEGGGVTHPSSSSSSAKYPHEDSGSSSYPKSTHPPAAQSHHHHQQPPHLHSIPHHPPLTAAEKEVSLNEKELGEASSKPAEQEHAAPPEHKKQNEPEGWEKDERESKDKRRERNGDSEAERAEKRSRLGEKKSEDGCLEGEGAAEKDKDAFSRGVHPSSSSSSAKYRHKDSGSSSYPKATLPPPVTPPPPAAQSHHHHQQPPHLHSIPHHPPLTPSTPSPVYEVDSRTVKGPRSEPRDGGERRSPSLPATVSSSVPHLTHPPVTLESRYGAMDVRSDGRDVYGETKREMQGPKGQREAKFERSGDEFGGKWNRGIYGESKRDIQGPKSDRGAKPERLGDDFRGKASTGNYARENQNYRDQQGEVKMEKEGHAHLPWKEHKDYHRGKRVEGSSANVEPWVLSRCNTQGSTAVGVNDLSAAVDGGTHFEGMYPWMYERFDKRQVCVEMICPYALVGNVNLEKLKKKNREADLRVYEHRGFCSIFISAVEQFSQAYGPTFSAALDVLPLCSSYDQAGTRTVVFIITERERQLISKDLQFFCKSTYACSVDCFERRRGEHHLVFDGTEEGTRELFCRILFLLRRAVFRRRHVQAVDFRTIEVEESYIGARMDGDTINMDFVKALIEGFKKQRPLHIRYINQILLQTTHVLQSLPSLVEIHVENGQCVIVCGDIHGQFYDLCNIFDMNGFPSEDKQYLFNGDFVDRGVFSVETILTLFALKCAFPLWIHLARGNHESRSLNEVHGFEKEVLAKLNETVMDMFSDAFCCLPLAHVLNKKVIVLHGGLFSRDGVTLSDIKSIQRFCQPPKRGLMRDLLWSDPQDSPGRSRSTRGEGIIFFGEDVTQSFLRDNHLDLLVRSHEVKQEGYEICHNGKLITIFSAPNYCDKEKNKGALIIFKAPEMKAKIRQFSAVRHPYRMWSQWPI